MHSTSWLTLPTEMKLQIVELLSLDQVKLLSKVDSFTYPLCVPSLFRKVSLDSYEALLTYLDHVPVSYHRYVRHLSVCTKPTSPRNVRNCGHAQTTLLSKLLGLSTGVERLSLQLFGSPAKDIIACFEHLNCLKSLHLGNCADERNMPLSERLVVSIALSAPRLEELSLDQIARSSMHASDLVGSYPYIPIVSGDEDIKDHSVVGAVLCLPSLLNIPTLHTLRIRNTHLGDPLWETTPCLSRLSTVDLGSCHHLTPSTSQDYVERIINNVAKSCDISQLAINTNLENIIFKQSTTPLPRLKHLQLTSFFPVDEVVGTLSSLTGSPIEQLGIQCFEDDISDLCSSLEEFLSLRVERGFKAFYSHLKEIVISFVAMEGDAAPITAQPTANPLKCEQVEAIRSFQEYCRDLGVEISVDNGVNPFKAECIIRLGSELMTGTDQTRAGSEMYASSEMCL